MTIQFSLQLSLLHPLQHILVRDALREREREREKERDDDDDRERERVANEIHAMLLFTSQLYALHPLQHLFILPLRFFFPLFSSLGRVVVVSVVSVVVSVVFLSLFLLLLLLSSLDEEDKKKSFSSNCSLLSGNAYKTIAGPNVTHAHA